MGKESQEKPEAAVQIRRKIPASREKVFEAWINPKLMMHWFGRNGEMPPARVNEIDARPGGKYLVEVDSPDGDTYRLDVSPQADETGLLSQAIGFEEAAARFFRDAAAKLPIREVVRLFQRMARENEQRLAQLGTLGGGGS